MKKLLGLFISLLLSLNLSVFASKIEVVPAMVSKSSNPDRVWVGTFQIVWNDFMDKFVGGNVRFKDGTPEFVWELNAKYFTTDDISDDCYYKFAGQIKKKTKKNIEKAIKKKFNETSDILDKLDLTPSPNSFLIYAMLKKNFEFKNEFDKFGKSAFGKTQRAEYFGIGKKSDSKLRNGVEVLFYSSPLDFAVKLETKDKDEVIIYKNSSDKNFQELFNEIASKSEEFEGEKYLKKFDELKIPNIKFFETKDFSELANKHVLGTNITIGQAMETVKFEMNNKGVKLKSEAAMTLMKSAFNPNPVLPRYFYFNDTFVIFLKEKNKNTPYFALRVNDITKFQ